MRPPLTFGGGDAAEVDAAFAADAAAAVVVAVAVIVVVDILGYSLSCCCTVFNLESVDKL